MLTSTLHRLKCPVASCGGELAVRAPIELERPGVASGVTEIVFGQLECRACRARFPILAGVAILVPDVRGYLIEHVKGITTRVPESRLPKEHRKALAKARHEIPVEHYESDLEAERVNALYVMNQFLSAQGSESNPWWKSEAGDGSPAIEKIVKEYWDHGPQAVIARELREVAAGKQLSLVEIGCGVGGLALAARGAVSAYLGVDSSFASIALARHLMLGAELEGAVLLPEDLLEGTVSRSYPIRTRPAALDGSVDFIVGDAVDPPLRAGLWDAAASLNMIDMLDDPGILPGLQASLLKPQGVAIQSCPYIWHPESAARLKETLPEEIHDSAIAVEWLYEHAGFEISRRHRHIPWVFFKHLRQIELYSVHLFFGTRLKS